MNKNQCFELGYILRPHGLDGAVVARFDVDQPSAYLGIDALFVESEGRLVPFLVRKVNPTSGQQVVLSLEGVSDDTQAQELKGHKLYLPEQVLPKLADHQYYYHELVGAQVEDEVHGKLGTIREIVEMPRQTIALMDWENVEVLIPVHEDIVLEFNRSTQTIKTHLPEGLLEVYTRNQSKDEVHAD